MPFNEKNFEANANGNVELYFDNTLRAATVSSGLQIHGVLTTNVTSGQAISLSDNARADFGSGDDLQIFHDGNQSIIRDTGTGSLMLQGSQVIMESADGGEVLAKFIDDGAVELYYDNSKKFETTSSGVTVTGTVSDTNGNVRQVPLTTKTSSYTAVASDAGKVIYISTGGVTLNNSVFSQGDMLTIINNSGSDQTITRGSGLTLYFTADGTSASRTLAGRGMATVYFNATSMGYISGSGLS